MCQNLAAAGCIEGPRMMLQSWMHEEQRPAGRSKQIIRNSIGNTLTKGVGLNSSVISDVTEMAKGLRKMRSYDLC